MFNIQLAHGNKKLLHQVAIGFDLPLIVCGPRCMHLSVLLVHEPPRSMVDMTEGCSMDVMDRKPLVVRDIIYNLIHPCCFSSACGTGVS